MKPATAVALSIALAAAVGAGGYLFGKRGTHDQAVVPSTGSPSQPERKVLYWHDPMVPQQKFDKPGKSPFMDMQLVPVYADQKAADGGVAVNARTVQNLGVRIVAAETTELSRELSVVGSVRNDERRIAQVQSRAAGWIEKLNVRAVNDPVRKGQVLAEIYSPELVAAQEEYLLARRMAQANAADASLARAARQRLAALGFPDSEVPRLDAANAALRRIPLIAPMGGVVGELAAREGQAVAVGQAIFTLLDLSSVWLAIEVPETQGSLLREGQRARASFSTFPGKVFEGRVDYVYPELNAATRTLKARITLANPGMELKPGMFADVTLSSASRKALTVPTEAVIRTGSRIVVVVADGDRFRPETVEAGMEAGGRTEILKGLKEGERVVASGQFLIDSEASLKSALGRIEGSAGPKPAAGTLHKGVGTVAGVDAAKGRVELKHEPIASIKWPAMLMGFVVSDPKLLEGLKPGDAVEFDMRGEPTKEGGYVLETLKRRSVK